MRFSILCIIFATVIATAQNVPRWMDTYRHGTSMDSVLAAQTDSLTFSTSRKLVVHRKNGTVDSTLLSAIDSLRFPFVGGPAVVIHAPTGGETYHVGDSIPISWTINPAAVGERVYMELSTDGGNTWNQFGNDPSDLYIFNNDPRYNAGHRIIWKLFVKNPANGAGLPDFSPISDQCKVRVVEYYSGGFDPELKAESAGQFAIRP